MYMSELAESANRLMDGVSRADSAAARRDILWNVALMIDETPLNAEDHPVRVRFLALVAEEYAR